MSTAVAPTAEQQKAVTKTLLTIPHGDRPAIVYPDGKTVQPVSRFEANAAAIEGRDVKAEADPNGLTAHTPGAKMDAGKAPIVQGVLQYFPRALKAVSLVSLAGATKYAWKGWESVPDGINRYDNALGRHLLAEAIEGPVDHDTQCLHRAQIAWNALAALELYLRKQETKEK